MPAAETHPAPVVISLVLRLADTSTLRQAVLSTLRAQGGSLHVGELRDCWLPVVAETSQTMDLHAWLESLPGVMFVDVTFVEVMPRDDAPACSGDFSQEPPLK